MWGSYPECTLVTKLSDTNDREGERSRSETSRDRGYNGSQLTDPASRFTVGLVLSSLLLHVDTDPLIDVQARRLQRPMPKLGGALL
jgi:hypothetical protein